MIYLLLYFKSIIDIYAINKLEWIIIIIFEYTIKLLENIIVILKYVILLIHSGNYYGRINKLGEILILLILEEYN